MRRLFRTPCYVLLAGSAFAYFWAGAALMSWVRLPLRSLWLRDDRRLRDEAQRGIQRAFRRFLHLIRVAGFIDVDPRRHVVPTGRAPEVLVANHPTLIDAVALLATHDKTCCVVKGSIFNGLLAGRLLRYAGHIDGGTGDTESVRRLLELGVDRLREGYSVLIFPEGTRSPAGAMHAFRRGAFELAARSGASVQPVLIRCEPPTLTRDMKWYRVPRVFARYRLERLSPVGVDRGRACARQAASTVRAALMAKLAEGPGSRQQPEAQTETLAMEIA